MSSLQTEHLRPLSQNSVSARHFTEGCICASMVRSRRYEQEVCFAGSAQIRVWLDGVTLLILPHWLILIEPIICTKRGSHRYRVYVSLVMFHLLRFVHGDICIVMKSYSYCRPCMSYSNTDEMRSWVSYGTLRWANGGLPCASISPPNQRCELGDIRVFFLSLFV